MLAARMALKYPVNHPFIHNAILMKPITPNPIVVDLDGTLISTDLLIETSNEVITTKPLEFLLSLPFLFFNRAKFKEYLAKRTTLDVSGLPYNEELIEWLKKRKSEGAELILATASHSILANKIAQYLGLFDAVHASTGNTNLKSVNKRNLLVSIYGAKGFEYIGNSKDDLPVWTESKVAHINSTNKHLISKLINLVGAKRMGENFAIKNRKEGKLLTLFKALRPHQWVKNLIVIAPLFLANQAGDENQIINSLIASIAFCLVASSGYILNDLIDIHNDRLHDTKKLRPFASGALSPLIGWLAWPTLVSISTAIACYLPMPLFQLVLGLYFLLTLAYSLKLKKIPILDVLILSILYTLRLVAGSFAINVPISFWALAFSMFIFLSLAFVKRYSEIAKIKNSIESIQITGRGYRSSDLSAVGVMGIGSAYLSILILALYTQDPHVSQHYISANILWILCPLLLFWLSRVWLITYREEMNGDPVLFAITDRVSWITISCMAIVFAAAKIL
jgi:4-hydroxybenzoate polyprenyltransferase